ncbi:hypothetical protein [Anaerosporobacter faecicola]|uniref:hypothetical protein n=1 Tax=Anaerosporobacter faecicola TaxID=2718714 RepID=UPI00143ACC03|nr:hypothetical protein [Anaerosporobacter faecicola]
MINLLHADLFRLKKSKALKGCLLVVTICAVLLAFVSHGVMEGEIDIAANTVSGLSDIFLMSVIVPLMVGILICGDFESKDIHDAISCGRSAIVLSKTISFLLVVCILVLPYVLVAFIGFLSGGSFSELFGFSSYTNLLASTGNYQKDSATILKTIGLLFTTIILYAGRLSICIPVAFAVRKPVLVTAIGVVFGFVVDAAVAGMEKIDGLCDLIDMTPYTHQVITLEQSGGEYIKTIFISVVFIVIMSGIAYLLFRKSEVK